MGYDAFVSYSSKDKNVADRAVAALEVAGVRCWLAPRDIAAGEEWAAAILRGIASCRVMVLIFSSSANTSPQILREVERAVSQRLPLVPFKIDHTVPSGSFEYFLMVPHWLDASSPPLERHLAELSQRVRGLLGDRATHPACLAVPATPEVDDAAPAAAPVKACLLYKRCIAADERLLGLLESHLKSLGHSIFIDRHLTIGVAWAQEIERRIRESDAVIPLLSQGSVHSEMLTYEVQVASAAARQGAGKPRVLPVRVGYDGPLPHDLASTLERLQYFLWRGPEDDKRLLDQLATAVGAPPAKSVDGEKLESASGAVPLDSAFYVVRPTDKEFLSAVARRDAIVLVKGARQMGKTSLLARGLQEARQRGAQAVFTDFQTLNNDQFASADAFYIALGELLADQLDLDAHPRDKWDDRRGPNANFDRFVRQQILKNVEGHVVWGLDEVDRLFTCPFGGEVFALFRTWHNARALNPAGPWFRLTLAIAYATEAHLFITDINQSPFNVGTRVTLQDFTLEQLADLNTRYGSPLRDGREVAGVYKLIGGHPFLSRRALYEMTTRGLALAEFEGASDREDGPFGDHLRRLLVMLARDQDLLAAMRGVLRGECCPSPEIFYRLRSAGVIAGSSAHDAQPRCELYTSYLRRHLL